MSKRTKAQQAERAEAIERLRGWIKPGDTVYTVLDSVSRSGMSRTIRVVLPYIRHEVLVDGYWRSKEGQLVYTAEREVIDHIHPNYAVATVLGYRQAKRGDGVIVSGCGMDMGYALVYSLGRALYPEFTCLGVGCPSNDHSNGDRDYTVGKPHSDGGYSLRHRWI